MKLCNKIEVTEFVLDTILKDYVNSDDECPFDRLGMVYNGGCPSNNSTSSCVECLKRVLETDFYEVSHKDKEDDDKDNKGLPI